MKIFEINTLLLIRNMSMIIILFIILLIVYKYNIQNDYLALLILVITILYIVLGWLYKCQNKNNKIITTKNKYDCIIGQNKKYSGIFFGGCFEFWHVSHFLLWLIIGLLSPYHYWVALALSIGWEGYEHMHFKNNGSCTNFSCGRVEDVVLNMGGYFLGSYMRTKQNETKQIKSKQIKTN